MCYRWELWRRSVSDQSSTQYTSNGRSRYLSKRWQEANFGTICVPFGFPGDVFYAFVDNAMAGMVPVSQTCGRPFGPGCYFPIGCTSLCYKATDAAGNMTDVISRYVLTSGRTKP